LSVLPAGFGAGVTGGSAGCVSVNALDFPLVTAGLTAARVVELGLEPAMAGFTGTPAVFAGGVTPSFSAGTALGLAWVLGLGFAEASVLGVAVLGFAEATVLGLSAGTGAGFAVEAALGLGVAPVPGVAGLGFADATVMGLSAGTGAGFATEATLAFAGTVALGLAVATTLGVAAAGGVGFAPWIAPGEPVVPATSTPEFEALR
jgi:hypothetical protein